MNRQNASTPRSQYLLGLGSNLGDRLAFLNNALVALEELSVQLIRLSSVYETKPIGAADQLFLNAAVIVETVKEPDELLESLLLVERSLGRERNVRWANRTVDCDILLADRKVIQNGRLTIPHPEMLERDFVLVPSAEIAPEWQHPILKKTLRELVVERGYSLPPSGRLR